MPFEALDSSELAGNNMLAVGGDRDRPHQARGGRGGGRQRMQCAVGVDVVLQHFFAVDNHVDVAIVGADGERVGLESGS